MNITEMALELEKFAGENHLETLTIHIDRNHPRDIVVTTQIDRTERRYGSSYDPEYLKKALQDGFDLIKEDLKRVIDGDV